MKDYVLYSYSSVLSFCLVHLADEWKNFLERIGAEDSDDISDDIEEEDFRNWASYRGQTLSRTGEWH